MIVEKALNPAAPETVDSGNNQGYNNNTNIDQNGGNVNVNNLDRGGLSESGTGGQNQETVTGTERKTRRTWKEDAESFRRRTEAIGTEGRGRQTVEIGETLFLYIPKSFDGSQASKAVEILNRAGIKAVYCEGDTESNSGGITTVHTEATTGPDGTVYVSSNSSLSAIQIAAHEAIHSKDILNSQEYLEFEAVVCDNILWGSELYVEIAEKINKSHYNGKYDIESYDFGGPFVKELMGYVNGFISEDATKAAEIFAPMFSNWEAVVEASRKFNEAIGLDFYDVDISGTPTEAADNSSVNEYNNTNTNSENGGKNNAGQGLLRNGSERSGRASTDTESRSGTVQGYDVGSNREVQSTGNFGRSSQVFPNQGNNRGIEPTAEQKESLKTTAIKDENGNPKVVFHFTNNMDFETFEKGDIGFHFGNEQQAIERGKIFKNQGRIIRAHLDIKNPINIPTDLMNWTPSNIAFKLSVEGIISAEDYVKIITLTNEGGSDYSSPAAVELRRILSEKGYDGIVYQNMFEGDGESYIAFYPEQVIIIDDGKGSPSVLQSNANEAADDTLAHPAPTAGKVLKMTPVSARAKNYVKAIGEALGWKVEFGPVRTPKGGKADGKINRNTKTLTIDPTSEKPIEFIFKHELAHIPEQDKGAYADLQNAIMDSKAFKDYVKSLGFETVSAYNADIVARYRTEGVKGFDSATAEYKANCEMVANFVGDCLFGGNNEVTAKLLEGMNQPQRRSFIRWVKEFFAKLKDKLSGKSKQLTDEISKLEDAFLKTLSSVETKENTVTEDGESYSFNDNLHQQLQDWLNGGGQKNGTYNGSYFELGTTPDVLTRHGAPSADIIMYSDVIVKVTGGKHSISLDEIAKLPAQLNDPILLFKGSVPNSFVALTEIVDKNGNDVIVAVHINKRHSRTVVNKIASLYSKSDDFGNNKIIGYINNQISAGNLIDASNTKAPNWFTSRGLQLPKEVQTILGANNRIAQKQPVVKNKYMQESEDYSISTAPTSRTEILTQLKNGEISVEEADKMLSDTSKKTMTPYEIAHLKPEDADVTSGKGNPKREGNGDRESRFYASALGSEIITPEIKAEIEKDTYIKNYQGTTNKRTLSIAAKELSEGGQERAQAFKELAKKGKRYYDPNTMQKKRADFGSFCF